MKLLGISIGAALAVGLALALNGESAIRVFAGYSAAGTLTLSLGLFLRR